MKVVLAQNVSLEGHLALSTYLRSIGKYLARKEEIELYLVVQGPGGSLKGLAPGRVRCIESDTYSLRGNAIYAWKLYRELCELHARSRIEVIHCLYPNSSLQAAALFKLTRAPGARIVYDLRSPWIEASVERLSLGREASLYRRMAYASESILSRCVDAYIFITRGLKAVYEERLGKRMEPSLIIPSGVDLDIFTPRDRTAMRERLGFEDEEVVIGYVGVLSRERELDFALRALRELRARSGRYRLLLVGDGDDRRRLQGEAAEMGLKDAALFAGRVDYGDVPSYISACDFGLCHLPDTLFFRQSFPMKVLEYAACGVPVLASRIRAHEEIAEELPLILYSTSSPAHLAEAVTRHEGRTGEVAEPVRRYGWEVIADELCAAYRMAAGKG